MVMMYSMIGTKSIGAVEMSLVEFMKLLSIDPEQLLLIWIWDYCPSGEIGPDTKALWYNVEC